VTLNRRRAFLVGLALATTFVALRVYLHNSPGTNFNVGTYNIHHLFTGLLLVTAGGLPLVLFHGDHRALDLSAIVFGAGLGMALDEWVYLITTDGTDASYLLPVSLWGGATMVALALTYLFILVLVGGRCARARSNTALERAHEERAT
jgi:hypothetical protein